MAQPTLVQIIQRLTEQIATEDALIKEHHDAGDIAGAVLHQTRKLLLTELRKFVQTP